MKTMWVPLKSTLQAVKALLPARPASPSAAPRYCLRFTGKCDEAEFTERCRQQAYWYHSFYFDNGFVQRGEYDIGRNVGEYGFPEDMHGMTVLDVGTGSGWFAAYFEQCGARATTVDIRGLCDHDWFGRPGYGDLRQEKAVPDRTLTDGKAIYYSPASHGFWIMKELLGLDARFVNSRIYDLSPDLFGGRRFDLVFLGSVLMHLRDPIGALMAVRSVCRGQVIANSLQLTRLEDDPLPLMALIAPSSHPACWWQPNRACLVEWFRGAGFGKVDADRQVRLSVDKPWLDERGKTTAFDQTHHLVHAWV
jgi:SAM-dependent methyltransferase